MSEASGIAACVAFGAMLMFVFMVNVPGGVVQEYHDAIDLCELKLPRDQTCRIIAIPKELEQIK